MNDLHDFYAASAAAAAALLGLLFVAITLSPTTVFGDEADPRKNVLAQGAFTALSNIFFVSLAALLPHPGYAIAAFAAVSFITVLARVIARARTNASTSAAAFVGPLIYALEALAAVRTALEERNSASIAYVLLGLYAYALGSSWTLLGAERHPRT